MNKNLCNVCVRADNNCPIWEPGSYTTECVEFRQDTSVKQVVVPPFEQNNSINNFSRHDEEGFEKICKFLLTLFGFSLFFFILAKFFN